MSQRAARTVLLAAALAAAGACASSGVRTDRDDADDGGAPEHTSYLDDGDRLMDAGDFESAARAYQRDLDAEPSSPVVAEKLLNARRRAAQVRAAQALAAAGRGDDDAARTHLATAQRYGADVPAVRRAAAELDSRLQAGTRTRDLLDAARAALVREPDEAARLLQEARELSPQDPEVVRLLREATLRSEAERAADRARAAWHDGRADDAVRELRSAQFAQRPVRGAETLRIEMEDDLLRRTASMSDLPTLRGARDVCVAAGLSAACTRTVRDRLVAALRAEASRLLQEGRPAVAALHEAECVRSGADIPTPALDAVRARAQVWIAVEPFDDATGGEVDGPRLARALADRLAADARRGGAAVGVIGPGPEQEKLLAAYPRALRLGGRVTAARVASGPRSTTARSVEVQVGSRTEANPERSAAESELAASRERLENLEKQLAAANEELAQVRSLPFRRAAGGERPGQGQVSYELAVARAQTRVKNLEREKSETEATEAAARRALSALPASREVPVMGTRNVDVTTYRKVASVTAHLRLAGAGDALFDADVTGSASHDETVAPAVPEAGLADDPDAAPDDAEMARRAADHFASVASGTLRAAAEQEARRFLDDARAAERAGRADEAAEGYALYLLATPEVATPRRADAARALQELTGVHVALRTGAPEEESR